MDYASGEILAENGLKKGYIKFSKKRILEIGKGNSPGKAKFKGLIIPSFVNAHTHIGDSFIREKKIEFPKKIEELVAPPNGLKHRLLKEADEEKIIKGMENSLDLMQKTGTEIFCDFREGGILGICQLKTAIDLWRLKSIILSRPESLEYNKNEVDILLKNSDGIGLSAISDWK
jgi:cytosine/adenosine deaminase-related metal-dependent hydrolase